MAPKAFGENENNPSETRKIENIMRGNWPRPNG